MDLIATDPGPWDVVVLPDGGVVTANRFAGTVTRIGGWSVECGGHPCALAVSGDEVVVVRQWAPAMLRIDAATGRVVGEVASVFLASAVAVCEGRVFAGGVTGVAGSDGPVRVDGTPVALAAAQGRLHVACAGVVHEVDAATRVPIAAHATSGGPGGIAADGATVVVACNHTARVDVLGGESVQVPPDPWGVAAAGGCVAVTHPREQLVSVLGAGTHTVDGMPWAVRLRDAHAFVTLPLRAAVAVLPV